MKQSKKLKELFYLGLVPVISIVFLALLLLFVSVKSSLNRHISISSNGNEKNQKSNECPPPIEKVIRDTIKEPVECKKRHYEHEKNSFIISTENQSILKSDTNDSETLHTDK